MGLLIGFVILGQLFFFLFVLIALLIAEPLVVGGMLLLVVLWINHTWRKVKAQARNRPPVPQSPFKVP
ncbi:MAG: hypothetical protein Q8K63_03915 [Acidimicrobiales bacterium]|nr:hypothetical protein [Acidimicrobiales bacterium]